MYATKKRRRSKCNGLRASSLTSPWKKPSTQKNFWQEREERNIAQKIHLKKHTFK